MNNNPIVNIIASKKSWIEGNAIQQLETTAQLPGMKMAVGLPDLHPGRKYPIGAVFVSEGIFYPQLAGNDIGCGMALWQTCLSVNEAKIEKMFRKLNGFSEVCKSDMGYFLDKYALSPSPYDPFLGTIGGGNHFAELQKVISVSNQAAFDELRLDKTRCFLLVHSGSRQLGQSIYDEFVGTNIKGMIEGSEAAIAYLEQHNYAIRWAKANREMIAYKFCDQIGANYELVLDVCHNEIVRECFHKEGCWFHRKGASTSRQGPVIIPGSRGHFSYLVQPILDQQKNAFSLAHGAGRKWSRSIAKANLSRRFKVSDLEMTEFKSRVICEDKDLIYEEAPQTYKDIEVVIQDLIDAELIDVIAILQPLITYKTRRIK